MFLELLITVSELLYVMAALCPRDLVYHRDQIRQNHGHNPFEQNDMWERGHNL